MEAVWPTPGHTKPCYAALIITTFHYIALHWLHCIWYNVSYCTALHYISEHYTVLDYIPKYPVAQCSSALATHTIWKAATEDLYFHTKWNTFYLTTNFRISKIINCFNSIILQNEIIQNLWVDQVNPIKRVADKNTQKMSID